MQNVVILVDAIVLIVFLSGCVAQFLINLNEKEKAKAKKRQEPELVDNPYGLARWAMKHKRRKRHIHGG